MDWYPLWNSLRIAAISSVIVFFAGIAAAYYVARLPRALKGLLDVVLTLPLVLPPTVCGYFLLLLFGNRRPRDFSGAIRLQVCHDLVRRRAGLCGGGVSSHVPHRPGRL